MRRKPVIVLRRVIDVAFVGACRYTGYVAKSNQFTLECGHKTGHRKASAGVPKRARCAECERIERERRTAQAVRPV